MAAAFGMTIRSKHGEMQRRAGGGHDKARMRVSFGLVPVCIVVVRSEGRNTHIHTRSRKRQTRT